MNVVWGLKIEYEGDAGAENMLALESMCRGDTRRRGGDVDTRSREEAL